MDLARLERHDHHGRAGGVVGELGQMTRLVFGDRVQPGEAGEVIGEVRTGVGRSQVSGLGRGDVAEAGVRTVLVGETLMRETNIITAMRELFWV